MMRIGPASVAMLALLSLAFGACSDNEEVAPTATPRPAETPTATRPPGTATTVPLVTRPPASATPPADGTVDPLGAGGTERWNVKANPENATGTILLKDVRMGVHPEQGGWDRIVFEFAGTARPAAVIEYVNSAAQCGSGAPVELKGAAILSFRFASSAAHDGAGQATFAKKEIPGPGTTILEAKARCDFEGVVGWAGGIKGKQNFKVTTLANPTRIVIDVKQ